MSLKFMDGAKHYATADILKKWGAHVAATIASTTPRRPGTKYVAIPSGYIQTKALSLTNRAVVGIGIRLDMAKAGAIVLYSGTTAQMCLSWDVSLTLRIRRGDEETGTILGSSAAGILPLDSWFYMEFDGTVDDSTGASEVRLNGSEVSGLTLTSQDTKPSAVTGVDRIRFVGSGSGTFSLTDIYIDSSTFHGDCVVETLMPSGAGAHADFVPSAGSNYENVDDVGAVDDDQSYNASNTQDDLDTFAYANLVAMPGSDIIGVAVNLGLRKDDAATREVKPVARIGSTDYLHGTGISPGGMYAVEQRVWETNPADSQPWEEADVNGAEFGYKQTVVA